MTFHAESSKTFVHGEKTFCPECTVYIDGIKDDEEPQNAVVAADKVAYVVRVPVNSGWYVEGEPIAEEHEFATLEEARECSMQCAPNGLPITKRVVHGVIVP